MRDERRAFPRFDVSLDLDCSTSPDEALRVHDLSEGGFLASGRASAKVWDKIEASIRLGTGEGAPVVRATGTIMHAHPDGGRLVLGIRIDAFGSPEEKRAYVEYARSMDPGA